jgi:hypothetical protein
MIESLTGITDGNHANRVVATQAGTEQAGRRADGAGDRVGIAERTADSGDPRKARERNRDAREVEVGVVERVVDWASNRNLTLSEMLKYLLTKMSVQANPGPNTLFRPPAPNWQVEALSLVLSTLPLELNVSPAVHDPVFGSTTLVKAFGLSHWISATPGDWHGWVGFVFAWPQGWSLANLAYGLTPFTGTAKFGAPPWNTPLPLAE